MKCLEELAKELVFNYLEGKVEKEQIRLTWFCKTLDNWKAMVADTTKGGMFFEITYSGLNKDVNIDAYKKFDSVRIPD